MSVARCTAGAQCKQHHAARRKAAHTQAGRQAACVHFRQRGNVPSGRWVARAGACVHACMREARPPHSRSHWPITRQVQIKRSNYHKTRRAPAAPSRLPAAAATAAACCRLPSVQGGLPALLAVRCPLVCRFSLTLSARHCRGATESASSASSPSSEKCPCRAGAIAGSQAPARARDRDMQAGPSKKLGADWASKAHGRAGAQPDGGGACGDRRA